jgi:hypothetical protein
MKRYLKLIILFILIVSCSGCVKYEENMKIRKNKSMDLEVIVAIDNKEIENDIFNEEEINNLKDFYTIEKYSDKKYSGYKLIYKTSNIDKVSSSSNDIVYSLTNIRNSVPTNIFRVKKGMFTNTYYADFIFDPREIELSDSEDNDCDLTFTVELDSKTIDNNANKSENNGKKLIWNLNKNDITEIQFSFTMTNYLKIVLTILFGLVMLILIFVSSKKILEKRV